MRNKFMMSLTMCLGLLFILSACAGSEQQVTAG